MAASEEPGRLTNIGEFEEDRCLFGEFVQRYNIPQTAIVCNELSHKFPSGESVCLKKGDVLLLRTVITGSITLSYYDPDTAYTRDVHLPVNFPGKFVVLPNRTSRFSPGTSASSSSSPTTCEPSDEHPYANYGGKVYKRVDNLLEEAPLYFKSTENFTDPLDSKLCFNAGDRFRWITMVCDGNGRRFLECKHMSGRLMRLPTYCEGQFQALKNRNYYTLSELVAMAPVTRRLRLAQDSINGMYPIPGLTRDYEGDIHMHKPVYYVNVSPWERLDIIWNLPINLEINIRHYAVDEYETPISHFEANRYTLAQFRTAYEDNFPVSACVENYSDKPREFSKYMVQRSPLVYVHKYDKVEKILAKHGDQHYVLSPRLNAKCVALPRTFSNISDLLKTNPGTKVRVLENIAWDIPKPLSLRPGDVIRVPPHVSKSLVNVNYKWNNTTLQVNVLKCERIDLKNTTHKIKLPLDLEVDMEETQEEEHFLPVLFQEFLDRKIEFPVTIELFPNEEEDNLSIPNILTLYCSIRDPCLYVSLKPSDRKSRRTQVGLFEIPERHLVMLSFEGLVNAEDVELTTDAVVAPMLEKVSDKLFSEMETTDKAYQTIAAFKTPVPLPTRNPIRSKVRKHRHSSLLSLSQLSKSLPSFSAFLSKKNKEPTTIGTIVHYPDEVLASEENIVEENLYEDVEIGTHSMSGSQGRINQVVPVKSKQVKRRSLGIFRKKISMDI